MLDAWGSWPVTRKSIPQKDGGQDPIPPETDKARISKYLNGKNI